MAQFISMPQNPVFSTVTLASDGMEFDPNNIRSGHMTKEEQLIQLYNRITALEKKHDECCRDIIFWEARVQIVRINRNTISYYNTFNSGGTVVSSFSDNIKTGKLRRGLPYTVTFPVKWDSAKYTIRNAIATNASNCNAKETVEYEPYTRRIVNYRIVEDDHLAVAQCATSSNNYARFWYNSDDTNESYRKTVHGLWINPGNNWGSFVHEVADDGTVTITDNRRNTDFNVIRYYTQWVLRECADGSMISDPE